MDLTGFYHEMKSQYAYATDINTLHIRLRTGGNTAQKVTLVICDPYNWEKKNDHSGEYFFNWEKCAKISMLKEYTAGGFDFWFAEACVPTKRAMYAFIAEDGNESLLYMSHRTEPFTGDEQMTEHTFSFFRFPYILEEDLFHAPEWAKDTVWYQIFPERFANSSSAALKKPDLTPWASKADVDIHQFYGGDLYGVLNHLDYIQSLGVTGIYFTPIFTSPSTHKYNTEDYFQIDPAFGDHQVFGELVEAAHRRGIRIMLDLVFNHAGSTHPFWRDVLEKGKASRYYDCFYIKEKEATGGYDYETFSVVKTMPKWNTANPFARQYLLDAAVYWARTYQIDGFRLDVANEVSHDFWREFRKTVRAVNQDLYIVGEVWENAMPWLNGDQFDTVMNYAFAGAVWGFVSGKTDGAGLKEALSAYWVAYPKDRQAVMFNLIGSHDTGRILTIANGRVERVMQAFVLLLTFAGSPCLFYGDEIGLTGKGMDRARGCMIWEEEKQNLLLKRWVTKMIALRKTHPAMKAAEVKWVWADETGVAYTKQSGDDLIAVVLNGLEESCDIKMPEEWMGKTVKNLLTEEEMEIEGTMRLSPYGVGLWRFYA